MRTTLPASIWAPCRPLPSRPMLIAHHCIAHHCPRHTWACRAAGGEDALTPGEQLLEMTEVGCMLRICTCSARVSHPCLHHVQRVRQMTPEQQQQLLNMIQQELEASGVCGGGVLCVRMMYVFPSSQPCAFEYMYVYALLTHHAHPTHTHTQAPYPLPMLKALPPPTTMTWMLYTTPSSMKTMMIIMMKIMKMMKIMIIMMMGGGSYNHGNSQKTSSNCSEKRDGRKMP